MYYVYCSYEDQGDTATTEEEAIITAKEFILEKIADRGCHILDVDVKIYKLDKVVSVKEIDWDIEKWDIGEVK